MPYWTEKRIAWYQCAISHSRFDGILADALEPHLADCETVCDLACGTGYLGMELARRGYRVSAIDRCETAIAWLRGESARRGLSMEIGCTDWTRLGEKRWDCVVMSMAGFYPRDLPYFLGLCRRRLILAVRADCADPHTVPLEQVLESGGYRYTRRPFSAELGQPFLSREDFREYTGYFRWSEKLQNCLRRYDGAPDGYPLYLPLRRNLMLYAVEANGNAPEEKLRHIKRHTLIVGSSGTDRSGFLTELLRRAAPGVPAYGYHSVKEAEDGDGNAPIYFYPVPGNRIRSDGNLLGWCRNRHSTTRPEVFDRLAGLLENAPADGVILLDELGPMETRSPVFCEAVMRCLNGDKPVVAAVRDIDTCFLNAVRTHPKAQCFFLTRTNRQELLASAAEYLAKQLKESREEPYGGKVRQLG